MTTATIEERLAALEEKVAHLTEEKPPVPQTTQNTSLPWWEQRFGAFRDDPLYEAAAQLGAEYRRAQPTAEEQPGT